MIDRHANLPIFLITGILVAFALTAGQTAQAENLPPTDSDPVTMIPGLDAAEITPDLSRARDDDRLFQLPETDSDSLQDRIGMGQAPLFESHGVYRSESVDENAPYFVLGYLAEEMLPVEDDGARAEHGFSYGFGVRGSNSGFEYMMSVAQDSYQTEAFGLRFTTQF